MNFVPPAELVFVQHLEQSLGGIGLAWAGATNQKACCISQVRVLIQSKDMRTLPSTGRKHCYNPPVGNGTVSIKNVNAYSKSSESLIGSGL